MLLEQSAGPADSICGCEHSGVGVGVVLVSEGQNLDAKLDLFMPILPFTLWWQVFEWWTSTIPQQRYPAKPGYPPQKPLLKFWSWPTTQCWHYSFVASTEAPPWIPSHSLITTGSVRQYPANWSRLVADDINAEPTAVLAWVGLLHGIHNLLVEPLAWSLGACGPWLPTTGAALYKPRQFKN